MQVHLNSLPLDSANKTNKNECFGQKKTQPQQICSPENLAKANGLSQKKKRIISGEYVIKRYSELITLPQTQTVRANGARKHEH